MGRDSVDKEAVGDLTLSSFLQPSDAMPTSSLLELSSDASLVQVGILPSGLAERVAKAWATPLSQLSCAQARVLVGQKFGLRWLAAPVAVFLQEHPRAECDLYPGDLMCAALRAHEQFLRFAPLQTRSLLEGDFNWMGVEFAFEADSSLLREATDDLAAARLIASVA